MGSSVVDSDGSITFPFSGLSVNTHVITLTVEDEVGATCTASMIYTVGTPPSITLESPLEGTIHQEGDTISFPALIAHPVVRD